MKLLKNTIMLSLATASLAFAAGTYAQQSSSSAPTPAAARNAEHAKEDGAKTTKNARRNGKASKSIA